jgi:1-acyl-sn-glycerol-3-phosphate acyltransferase
MKQSARAKKPADRPTAPHGAAAPAGNREEEAMPARVRSIDRTAPRRRSRPTIKPSAANESGPRRPFPSPMRRRAKRSAWDLLGEAVREFGRQINPDIIGAINEEVAERIHHIPTQLNEYGYDPWGFNVDVVRRALVVSTLLYRHYFRVETHGIENLPDGRMLVISNHAGQVAIDAAMIGTATFWEGEPPRVVRGMGEYWLPTVPFVNVAMSRTGSVVGTPHNCTQLLRNGEAVIAFPEGVRGMNKLFSERYRLQRFGSGFMRLALATKTPIVPVAVVGSEEQAPGLANITSVAQLLGMPAFPVTLTWPWLGPIGLLPFPVKYRIYFGRPLHFKGDADDEDAVIEKQVGSVKSTIQAMLDHGVRERPSIFF